MKSTTKTKNSPQNINNFPHKLEFLSLVLEAEEKRRNSVESRVSILIAADAVLISAIAGLGIPKTQLYQPIILLQLIFSILAFSATILSVLWAIQVITPINYRNRNKTLDLGKNPPTEFNLFYFMAIEKFDKAGYLNAVNSLTEREIIQQVAAQIHNVSRLLTKRYYIMRTAHLSFFTGLFCFAVLSITNIVI